MRATGELPIPDQGAMRKHLWGYLESYNPALKRINFKLTRRDWTIGQDPNTNSIVLHGTRISRSHCVVKWDGADYAGGGNVFVTDTSRYGTYINGERIGLFQTGILLDGDQIAFGSADPQLQNNAKEDYRFVYHHVAASLSVSTFADCYTVDTGPELGKGSFAVVRKALHRKRKVWYAVKMIAAATTVALSGGRGSDPNVVYLAREIGIMRQLAHRNICKLIETFFELDGSINLVLEYAPEGHLLKLILDSKTGIEEHPAKDITYQICDALAYIHSRGVVHRDLKPANILLSRKDPPLIKVADFGLAKILDNDTMLDTMCGTPTYVAPEVVLGSLHGYTNTADSYSLGVIVFAMLTRQEPFYYQAAHKSVIARTRNRRVNWAILEQTSRPLSPTVKHFIKRLLVDDPSLRLTATDALGHQWLRAHAPFYGVRGEPEDISSDWDNPNSSSQLLHPTRLPHINVRPVREDTAVAGVQNPLLDAGIGQDYCEDGVDHIQNSGREGVAAFHFQNHHKDTVAHVQNADCEGTVAGVQNHREDAVGDGHVQKSNCEDDAAHVHNHRQGDVADIAVAGIQNHRKVTIAHLQDYCEDAVADVQNSGGKDSIAHIQSSDPKDAVASLKPLDSESDDLTAMPQIQNLKLDTPVEEIKDEPTSTGSHSIATNDQGDVPLRRSARLHGRR